MTSRAARNTEKPCAWVFAGGGETGAGAAAPATETAALGGLDGVHDASKRKSQRVETGDLLQ